VRSLVGRADEVIERGAAQPRTWLIAVHESPPGPIRSRIRIQPDFLARLDAWRVVQLGGLTRPQGDPVACRAGAKVGWQ
jgi:hypothetical protein